jgi:DNA-3-methyladenine glycosylase I
MGRGTGRYRAFDMTDDAGRCWWAGTDPLMVAYHDDEWGRPSVDETHLYEMLTLEGAQAGLSWQTILRKREGYRNAFAGFEVRKVASYDDADRERLMNDAAIVRNRAKIDSAIGNAGAFLEVAREFGSFRAYLETIVPMPPARLPADAQPGTIPVTTGVSDALSKDLKKRGFRFVGSTIVYSFMQATGLVDDHLPSCFRYAGRGSMQ